MSSSLKVLNELFASRQCNAIIHYLKQHYGWNYNKQGLFECKSTKFNLNVSDPENVLSLASLVIFYLFSLSAIYLIAYYYIASGVQNPYSTKGIGDEGRKASYEPAP